MPMTRNGPATASLVLILLGLVGVAAVVWGLTDTYPSLAQPLRSTILALLGAALILAIASLAIAVTRPTKKGASVLALVLAFLLLFGITLMFGLNPIAN